MWIKTAGQLGSEKSSIKKKYFKIRKFYIYQFFNIEGFTIENIIIGPLWLKSCPHFFFISISLITFFHFFIVGKSRFKKLVLKKIKYWKNSRKQIDGLVNSESKLKLNCFLQTLRLLRELDLWTFCLRYSHEYCLLLICCCCWFVIIIIERYDVWRRSLGHTPGRAGQRQVSPRALDLGVDFVVGIFQDMSSLVNNRYIIYLLQFSFYF